MVFNGLLKNLFSWYFIVGHPGDLNVKPWIESSYLYRFVVLQKKTKIELLNLNCKNFKMDPNEDIKVMFDRFYIIFNELKGFGEMISEEKLVSELIYSLPDSWD
ncbi:hypothetical protein GQ457_05G024570 [Hibiscus cannabinus]